ncbi:MAG TPA: hypothetical protein VMW58_09540 [Anaerolineae bacterium]|nr:hypothetical protein [Anaerolineae bacterium]
MMTDLYIGIDPGLDGAVGFIGRDVVVFRTPTIKVGKRRQYRAQEMAQILQYRLPVDRPEDRFAILESVHSMPGQGVASSFSFGRGFGLWEGILVALGIPYLLVAPQTWKAAMLRDMPHDKNAAKLQASRLWPELGHLSDGEAEALLMAEYGRRLQGVAE